MTQPHDEFATSANGEVGSLQFIGNATVLLRLVGLTLLTDPNFVPRGEKVPLGYGLSTTRLTDPAMAIDDLPPLDAVLLSHFHGDHFDHLAEERLDRWTPIITTPQAAGMLAERGFERATPLEGWATRELAGDGGQLRITALPARHAPGPFEIAMPEVMGSLIEVWRRHPNGADTSSNTSGPDLRIYISGDTIVYEGLTEIPDRTGMIDLALLHLGGTRVLGVTVTMDADQGLELLETIRPMRAAAIHYDDYDAFKSPIADFVARVRDAGLSEVVRPLSRGETVAL